MSSSSSRYSKQKPEVFPLLFALTNRSFGTAWLLATTGAFLLVISASLPDEVAARAPACTEYCYEPIPVPGADTGEPGKGPDAGESGVAVDSQDGEAVEELSEAELALGVIAARSNGGGGGSSDGTNSVAEAESEAALSSPNSSTDTGSGASGVWIVMTIVLGVATLALIVVGLGRMRRGGLPRGDVLIRGLALAVGIGLVFLLSPGVSGASAAKAPRGFFGVMSIEQISELDAERMATGGISTYRFPMSWDSVQRDSSSGLDWGIMDLSVAASASAGLRVLPIMAATPKGFASNWTYMPIATSAQRQGWNRFLREAIRRYGPKGDFWRENPELPRLPVRTWQVWNEANFFYFTEPVVPANYLKLLKASHKVIKQEDPGAKVMMSGLFGSPPNDPRRSMKSWQFLAQLYKMGAKPYFDSVAIHPYSPDTTQLRLIIEKVRSTMNRYGGKKTPIYVTEIGWGSDSRTLFGKGSLRGQAQQLTSGYDYLIRNRKKMGIRSAYWFAWKDLPTTFESCNQCYFSGLFESGPVLKPKPAWDAFVKITGGKRG